MSQPFAESAQYESPSFPRQVRAFEAILALVLTAEYWSRALKNWGQFDPFLIGSAILVTVLAGLVLLNRWRRLAFAGLAATVVTFIALVFPAGGNHEYLELGLCLLCAVVGSDSAADRVLLTRAVRWTACVIFFWAGLQKLVHGYYFNGEYLAYSISRESYRNFFAWLLAPDELARLAAYDGTPGTGPYRTESPLFLAVSSMSCVIEVLLVPLLIWPKTRRVAVGGAFLLLIAIESAAREMFFFLLLANMLLMFLDSDLNRRLLAPIAMVLAGMLLIRMGVLPEVTFN